MTDYSIQKLRTLCKENNLENCSGKGVTKQVLYEKLVTAGFIEKTKTSPRKRSPKGKRKASPRKPCRTGTVLNEATGRCIKIDGPTYKKLVAEGKLIRARSPRPKKASRSKFPKQYYSDIEELPNDMLYEMAMKMDGEDLVNFCSTNSNLNTLCNKRKVWENKIEELKEKGYGSLEYLADPYSYTFSCFNPRKLYMFLLKIATQRFSDGFLSKNLDILFFENDYNVRNKLIYYYADKKMEHIDIYFEIRFEYDEKDIENTVPKLKYLIVEGLEIDSYIRYSALLYTEKEFREMKDELYGRNKPSNLVYVKKLDMCKVHIYGVTGPTLKNIDKASKEEVYAFLMKHYKK